MLLWLSVGLAADAFAVSLSLGMTAARLRRIPAEAAGLFGLFQGGMPLLGYGLARLFAGLISLLFLKIVFEKNI